MSDLVRIAQPNGSITYPAFLKDQFTVSVAARIRADIYGWIEVSSIDRIESFAQNMGYEYICEKTATCNWQYLAFVFNPLVLRRVETRYDGHHYYSYASMTFEIIASGRQFRAILIHTPRGNNRRATLNSLLTNLDKFRGKDTVVFGDFNMNPREQRKWFPNFKFAVDNQITSIGGNSIDNFITNSAKVNFREVTIFRNFIGLTDHHPLLVEVQFDSDTSSKQTVDDSTTKGNISPKKIGSLEKKVGPEGEKLKPQIAPSPPETKILSGSDIAQIVFAHDQRNSSGLKDMSARKEFGSNDNRHSIRWFRDNGLRNWIKGKKFLITEGKHQNQIGRFRAWNGSNAYFVFGDGKPVALRIDIPIVLQEF